MQTLSKFLNKKVIFYLFLSTFRNIVYTFNRKKSEIIDLSKVYEKKIKMF